MDSRYREETAKQDRDTTKRHRRLHRCENTNAVQYPVIRFVVLASKNHQGEFEFFARPPAMMEPLYEVLSIGAYLPPVGDSLNGNHDDAENQDDCEDDDARRGRKLRRHRDGDGSRRQEHRQYSGSKTQQGPELGILHFTERTLFVKDQRQHGR